MEGDDEVGILGFNSQLALLILAGHPHPHPHPSNLILHPGAIQSLQSIHLIAKLYLSINHFVQSQASTPALASLASAIQRELVHYHSLLANLEYRLLSHHPSLVPYQSNLQPCPPLSAILAELNPWHSIFIGLHAFLKHLQSNPTSVWSTPELIQLLYLHSQSGSAQLSEIFSRLQKAIEHLWLDTFRSFVIYGQRPHEHSTHHHSDHQLLHDLFLAQRSRPAGLTSDQLKHQPLLYQLKPGALPSLPSLNPHPSLLQSIAQICLALSILSHLYNANTDRTRSTRLPMKLVLPSGLQSQLADALSEVNHLSHPGFRHAIESVQG